MAGRFGSALRLYADFAGRASRTELALFGFFALLLNFALGFATAPFGARANEIAQSAFLILFLCPAAAIVVRRLHDQGRRGWWALLGLPALVLTAAERWYRLQGEFAPLVAEEPFYVGPVAAAAALALFVLLLLPDEEGPNRYGANPRFGQPDAA